MCREEVSVSHWSNCRGAWHRTFSESASKSQSGCAISTSSSISLCLTAIKGVFGSRYVFLYSKTACHSCSEIKLERDLKCRPYSLIRCCLTSRILHFQSHFLWIKVPPRNIGLLQSLFWRTLTWGAFCKCHNWFLLFKFYFNCQCFFTQNISVSIWTLLVRAPFELFQCTN